MALDFEKPIIDIEHRIAEMTKLNRKTGGTHEVELVEQRRRLSDLRDRIYSKLTPWQTVQVARHPDRPLVRDFIAGIFSEFIELHGDRNFGDDNALIGGFATVDDVKVMVIGMHKGRSVEEKVKCNFGMANPEGYRKALRLMRLAEKYAIPVVCLVDTPAAYPGKEAEERGQAEAIARNLTEMATLAVPILVVVTGEGGSGGALGIAVGDTVLMLANAIYSVIPPEGCAAILWRDGTKGPEAAEALKLTAPSLLDLNVIDGIIPEPHGAAHRDPEGAIKATKAAIVDALKKLRKLPVDELIEKRFEKFASMGGE